MSEINWESVTDWLQRYGKAWEDQDEPSIMAIFTVDAAYSENPFEPTMVGREAIGRYWRTGAVEAQRDIHVTSELWSLADDVAIAHWSANYIRTSSEARRELDGVFHLGFVDDGGTILCSSLREWWFGRDILR